MWFAIQPDVRMFRVREDVGRDPERSQNYNGWFYIRFRSRKSVANAANLGVYERPFGTPKQETILYACPSSCPRPVRIMSVGCRNRFPRPSRPTPPERPAQFIPLFCLQKPTREAEFSKRIAAPGHGIGGGPPIVSSRRGSSCIQVQQPNPYNKRNY